jgi:SAM-dependent methyltransferase
VRPRPPAPPAASPPPRERRALSHVGGKAETFGDRELAEVLRRAVDVPDDPALAREHVHGFHSYPARLHPLTAARAITGLSPPSSTVLDPFAGSGTVVVEARLAGRRALGIDLNPLAVRLARLKSEGRSEEHLAALEAAAKHASEVATTRRKARAGSSRGYPPEDVAAFAPHVLLELDGLRLGIAEAPSPSVRADLEIVLSSLLTKMSRAAGDSAEGRVEKRIAAGFPSKMLMAKTRELASRVRELVASLPPGVPAPDVREGDARKLPFASSSVDLVVTSPPYPGNYDYLHHHATRLRWLGLSTGGLSRGEIGARRHLEREPDRALSTFSDDLAAVLAEMKRVLRPSGSAVLVLADSVVKGRAFYNDELLAAAARTVGLSVIARASQARPHFHGGSRDAFRHRPRREHAVLLASPRRPR